MKCENCLWMKIQWADKCTVTGEIVRPEHTACTWQQRYLELVDQNKELLQEVEALRKQCQN